MHVQIVTFRLGNLSEQDYLTSADAVAPGFSTLGGLMSRVWLERSDDATYGAVYLWRDREAMERFLRSPLFEGNNSELQDVTSEEFGVLKNLTKKTQPELELIS